MKYCKPQSETLIVTKNMNCFALNSEEFDVSTKIDLKTNRVIKKIKVTTKDRTDFMWAYMNRMSRLCDLSDEACIQYSIYLSKYNDADEFMISKNPIYTDELLNRLQTVEEEWMMFELIVEVKPGWYRWNPDFTFNSLSNTIPHTSSL